jgi:hypothetical protein
MREGVHVCPVVEEKQQHEVPQQDMLPYDLMSNYLSLSATLSLPPHDCLSPSLPPLMEVC